MVTNNTHPTFKSASSLRDLPVYAHSDAKEFIRIDNFDLFEYMLWHQGVARDDANARAEDLRRKGTLTLVGSPYADAAAHCRGYFERLQNAFDTFFALKNAEKNARQNRGQAKGRVSSGWQSIFASTFISDVQSMTLERLHSYKAADTAYDVVAMMMAPAFQSLNQAQQDLGVRLYLLRKTTVKEMAMHNVLCARRLLMTPGLLAGDTERHDDAPLSQATQFLISDQWDVDTLGDKLSTGLPKTDKPFTWE